MFERLAHAVTLANRERVGRPDSSIGAVPHAQAARSDGAGVKGTRGHHPARGFVGRKRRALTDTDGCLLVTAVSPGNLYDGHGGVTLLCASRGLGPFLTHCLADRAYRSEQVSPTTAIAVEIIEREESGRDLSSSRVTDDRAHLRLDRPLS